MIKGKMKISWEKYLQSLIMVMWATEFPFELLPIPTPEK